VLQCQVVGTKGPCQTLSGCVWVSNKCEADPQGYPGGSLAPSAAPTATAPSIANRCQSTTADVVFVVDQSGSITPPNDYLQRKWLRDFVGSFDVGSGLSQTRFALVTFSAKVLATSSFAESRATNAAAFQQYILDLKPVRWSTNTPPALFEATKIVKSMPVISGRTAKKVAIILTDGNPNVKCDRPGWNPDPLRCTRQQFASLKAEADQVIFVRLGTEINSNIFGNSEHLRVDADWLGMQAVLTKVLDYTCV
jgi:hypothetical protein